jgi:hypothetical protein
VSEWLSWITSSEKEERATVGRAVARSPDCDFQPIGRIPRPAFPIVNEDDLIVSRRVQVTFPIVNAKRVII